MGQPSKTQLTAEIAANIKYLLQFSDLNQAQIARNFGDLNQGRVSEVKTEKCFSEVRPRKPDWL